MWIGKRWVLFRVSLIRKTPEGHCSDDWTLFSVCYISSFIALPTGQPPMGFLADSGRYHRALDAKLGSYRVESKDCTCWTVMKDKGPPGIAGYGDRSQALEFE